MLVIIKVALQGCADLLRTAMQKPMKLLFRTALTLLLALNTLGTQADDASVMCLEKNIYFEARGEPKAGKLAVAKVTLNRVASLKFPGTVCDVVYQKHQFSWTKNHKRKIVDSSAWRESLEIARHAIDTKLTYQNLPVLYFHNATVSPKWGKKRVAKIGNHYFYK